jgi:multisubunit Na+/H+ antiporter MnhC subunit
MKGSEIHLAPLHTGSDILLGLKNDLMPWIIGLSIMSFSAKMVIECFVGIGGPVRI